MWSRFTLSRPAGRLTHSTLLTHALRRGLAVPHSTWPSPGSMAPCFACQAHVRFLCLAPTALALHRGAPPRSRRVGKASPKDSKKHRQKTKEATKACAGQKKHKSGANVTKTPVLSPTASVTPYLAAFVTRQREQEPAEATALTEARTDTTMDALVHFTQDASKVARRTAFTQKSMSRDTARRAAANVDFTLLDYVADNFTERDVLDAPWHKLNTITDAEINSIRAHDLMFMYDAGINSIARLTAIGDVESRLLAELRGKALYVRLVDLGEPGQTASATAHDEGDTHNHSDGATNEEPQSSPEEAPRKNGRSRQKPDARVPARSDAALVRHVMAAVEAVLADYTVTFVHPFHMEVGCDVSHYASAVPVAKAARQNVAQYYEDAYCLMSSAPFPEKSRAVYATKAQLEPLTADAVAMEVAHRIRHELFAPEGDQQDEQRGQEGAQRTNEEGKVATRAVGDSMVSPPHPPLPREARGRFCVCIGVADRPVLAKMACDAEVVALRLQQRHRTQPETDQSSAAASSSSSSPPDQQELVRVRSFYAAIRTVKDARDFVAPFRLHHVPTLSPAVIRILRDVFHIDKVGDIYPMRERLFFSLSKETFRQVYAAAFGCMRFAEERKKPLICPANMDFLRESLLPFATNAIALLTPSRTAMRAHSASVGIRRSSRRTYGLGATDHTLSYGRLFTEQQFISVADRIVDTLAQRLQRKGYDTGGFRISLRRGAVHTAVHTVMLDEPTNDVDILTAAARKAAGRIAKHRLKRGTFDTSSEPVQLNIGLLRLQLTVMNPPRLASEIDEVNNLYRTTYDALRSSTVYRSMLRESRSGVIKLRTVKDTDTAEEEKAEEQEEPQQEEVEEHEEVEEQEQEEENQVVKTQTHATRPTKRPGKPANGTKRVVVV